MHHFMTPLKIPKLSRKTLRTSIPSLSRPYRRLLRQRERCLVPPLSKSLLVSTWVSFLTNRKAGMSGWSMKWNDYPMLAFGYWAQRTSTMGLTFRRRLRKIYRTIFAHQQWLAPANGSTHLRPVVGGKTPLFASWDYISCFRYIRSQSYLYPYTFVSNSNKYLLCSPTPKRSQFPPKLFPKISSGSHGGYPPISTSRLTISMSGLLGVPQVTFLLW